MIASYVLARPMQMPYARLVLLGALAACLFFVALGVLARQPAPLLAAGTGMYAAEGNLRWTGSQAEFALVPHTGPTTVALVLQFSSWPGRPETQVWLESDSGPIASFGVSAQRQHLRVLLPPGATFLRLRSALGHPPGDWRWLGVQVLAIDAAASGLPSQAIARALLCALGGVGLALGLAWATARGYGPLAALTMLGLALRLIGIGDSPPMIHRDEAVSLVDAWHLARTGHDHLGHLLPIAAFESYGDWISPMLTYLLVPWVGLFGPQPIVARLVVAVFGALAIPAIYGLAHELNRPVAAICAALVAALSPWQIFLSRVAIPPALVATTWALCLWAAVRFIRRGRRRDAFWLAAAAGLALYAYPTMKMTVPLLVACAAALAAQRHGWRALARWALPALVLGIAWMPFVFSTLFNPSSGARLQVVAIKAETVSGWMALWWQNYTVYFQPRFYYTTGGLRKIVQGVQGRGMALGAEALLLLGLLVLPIQLAWRRAGSRVPPQIWLFLLLMIALAPLPASLTNGNPHTFRAAALAPLYALAVGVGASVEWHLLGYLPRLGRTLARGLAATALVAAMAWQSSAWFYDLLNSYPAEAASTWFFADGELATMRRVASYAPHYDQVWVDARSIGRPYIFLLASEALPPAEAQARLVLERHPPEINSVSQLGSYYFYDFATQRIPDQLATLEALPTSAGLPGYLIQEWRRGDLRLLIVRAMPTEAGPNDPLSTDTDSP